MHVRFAFWLCEKFGDFGKREPGESLEREREIVVVTLATRAWRVTGKLGDFGKEKERVPGESLESIGKS